MLQYPVNATAVTFLPRTRTGSMVATLTAILPSVTLYVCTWLEPWTSR